MPDDPNLPIIVKAHRDQSPLGFSYHKPRSSVDTHQVTPTELHSDYWVGWDHDKNDYRRFRFDRIVGSVDAPQ